VLDQKLLNHFAISSGSKLARAVDHIPPGFTCTPRRANRLNWFCATGQFLRDESARADHSPASRPCWNTGRHQHTIKRHAQFRKNYGVGVENSAEVTPKRAQFSPQQVQALRMANPARRIARDSA